MQVRYKGETPTTVTYEWDPPAGQQIVRTTRADGVQTVFWSATKAEHTFKKKLDGRYPIDVFGLIDSGYGTYPPVSQPVFGFELPDRLPVVAGKQWDCSTPAQAVTAGKSANPGDVIALSSDLDFGFTGDLPITRSGTPDAPITVLGLNRARARLMVLASYLRIFPGEVYGTKFDGIKLADFPSGQSGHVHHVEIEGGDLHDLGENGILAADTNPTSDIQIWRNRVERTGLAYPADASVFHYHSCYVGGTATRWLLGENEWHPRTGYGAHLYPRATDILCFRNTSDGGLTRGGYAIRGSGTARVRVVGDIITNSPTGAFEITAPQAATASIEDCLEFGNAQGTWAAGYPPASHVSNVLHADPRYTNGYHLGPGSPAVGLIRPSNYGVVTADDAGCYAA